MQFWWMKKASSTLQGIAINPLVVYRLGNDLDLNILRDAFRKIGLL
jgi:hypothetical protein